MKPIALVCALAVVFAGCGGDSKAREGLRPVPVRPTMLPEESVEELPPTPEGLVVTSPIPGTSIAAFGAGERTVVGRVFGSGRRRGVVLLHASGEDMRSWYPFAQRLMNAGYAALPFDFGGYGQSEGSKDPVAFPDDVAGAVRFLRALGSREIAIVGVEAGGTAAVGSAGRLGTRVKAMAALSAGPVFQTLDVSADAPKVRARGLVVQTGAAGEADLARLLGDAEVEQAAGVGDPEVNAGVQGVLLRFLRRALAG